MGQGRITFVEKFDYNFERNKNYRTFRHERISWRPVEVIRRWGHRWMAAAPCSDRFVGAGTPVASRKVSQRKSWKSSSWRSYLRRPGSGQRANRCTRCLCSRIVHCVAATVADASQFHGSRCTRIHRIRRSWWWGWCQLLSIDQIKRKFLINFHKESQKAGYADVMCRLGRFSVRYQFFSVTCKINVEQNRRHGRPRQMTKEM